MANPKVGTKYECGYCGTTLLVTREGLGCVEDIVCCEKPMTVKKPVRSTKKARSKKKK